jgi:hypothetical protein
MNIQLSALKDTLLMPTSKLKKKLWGRADIKGNDYCIYIPKYPDKNICLVAHIDTAHDGASKKNGKEKGFIFHDTENHILWNPEGTGADDRAGVYALMLLWERLPIKHKPLLLFTDYEESGGAGAYEAAEDKNLEGIGYFIELDRKNGKQAVFYNDEPGTFKKHILKYGFIEGFGTFSDISILGPELGKCAVNLSSGYYHEHTRREYLNYAQLENTINKVFNICMNHKGEVFNLPNARPVPWYMRRSYSSGLESVYCGADSFDYENFWIKEEELKEEMNREEKERFLQEMREERRELEREIFPEWKRV